MTAKTELLQRRLAREVKARKQAEAFLEAKSRELWLKGQELEQAMAAERQARREAEILHTALQVFASKLDFSEIAAQLGEFLSDLSSHESSAIYYAEGDGIRRHLMKGDLTATRVMAEEIDGAALLHDMRQTRQPVLISDPANAADARRWGLASASGQWIFVPMMVRGDLVGALILQINAAKIIDDANRRLIQALANEAAIAFENARLFKEVERLSATDPLTNLCNRRQFDQAARQEFERAVRYDFPLTAIIMDIDFFKKVNDTYGHSMGDSVLVEVAAACLRGCRLSDVVSRYGGEEFCFLLPVTKVKEAYYFAERLRDSIAQLQFEADGRRFSVTASFGIATRLKGQDTIVNLLERCDQALYQAKEQGRNRVVIWR